VIDTTLLALMGVSLLPAVTPGLGHGRGHQERARRVRQWMERVTGVVLLGFGAGLALERV
jgi:threonine/homoserine/homoserine lactone efflux protein